MNSTIETVLGLMTGFALMAFATYFKSNPVRRKKP